MKHLSDGFTITKLDLKNAFNSVPRSIIIAALKSHGINNKFITYLEHFLNNRKCTTDFIEYQVDGVPQGDKLSMLLFTTVMSLITERVNKIFLNKQMVDNQFEATMIAYIDDSLIMHKGYSSSEVYEIVK